MRLHTLCAVLLLTITAVQPAAHAVPVATTPQMCPAVPMYKPEEIRIIGADAQSKEVKELLEVYNDLVAASNRHAIADILKHYSPQYISGDNLTLEQVKNLIEETWKSYPDICYVSKPLEIRFNGDWATLETMESSKATAQPDKDIMNVPGKLTSNSRSLLFFRRTGNTWEINSDSTLWEEAVIRYGIGEDIEITLSAPEQVKAGEAYSATIQAKIPEGTFSIATIDNQPLTYPHQKVDDKFRALDTEANSLQRVLKANTGNHNEVVTATLGLTALEQKSPERPSLSLNGIATIVKRVNVVPISAEDVIREMKKQDLVKTSADGKINLLNVPPPPESTTPTVDLELVPSDNSDTDNQDNEDK